jgi:hypothetical protein
LLAPSPQPRRYNIKPLSTCIEPGPVAALSLLSGRTIYRSTGDYVHFSLDTDEFDFHIDASPDAPPAMLAQIVSVLETLGLELMDDDECEPELLGNGWTRLYLTPITAVEDDQMPARWHEEPEPAESGQHA